MYKDIKDKIEYLERCLLRAWIQGIDTKAIKQDLDNYKAELEYISYIDSENKDL